MQASTLPLRQRYEIIRPMAQGETGAVYEARDWNADGSPVALKLCVFNTEELRAMGARAAQRLTRFDHPSLPKVHDLFAAGGGHYLVMDFVEGDDLEALLQTYGGPFDFRTVLAWADQLLDALNYLHQLEPPAIHRDIKPANLKLSPQGRAMLLDFGLEKEDANSPELYSAISPYVPLEQIDHSGTDARADLYALGATLFHLLTGAAPENALVRLKRMAGNEPDPQRLAHELVPEIPLMVAQAIHHALALYPEERYQTAQEMRAALQLALKTAPSPSQPLPRLAPELDAIPPPPPAPPIRPKPTPQPVMVKVAVAVPRVMLTTTVPVPPANLARQPLRWHYAALWLVLLLGGSGMGLLARQILGKSSAEPPARHLRASLTPSAASSATPVAVWPAQFTNRFGASFRLLPAGQFTMGSAQHADAQPQHIVTLARPFYLSVYEITQLQWRALMRNSPSVQKGETLPVENVTWFDVQRYIAQINLLRDGYSYRLPTEAEWEYAARAGQAGEAADELTQIAWFAANAAAPQPVGQKAANAFGLHDMLGNVAEWCADSYHESYVSAPVNGEAWLAATGLKLFRIIRGESWQSEAGKVHAGYRGYNEPHFRSGTVGFRLVAEPMAGEE
jgi:formylglycine-generating enzyme required for sulfatase activity